MDRIILTLDHGTTSSRCILFDHHGKAMAFDQQEHRMIYPKPGWVEQDPLQIWKIVQQVIEGTIAKASIDVKQIAAMGITNQRETVCAWNRNTGRPYGNALVWQDTRGSQLVEKLKSENNEPFIKEKTGLPLSSYFSSSKMVWMLKNYPGLAEDLRRGDALWGTMDSYLIWQLSGGPRGGVHVTDITNASRTQLMDLQSLSWDQELLNLFAIPSQGLAEIKASIPESPLAVTIAQGPLGAEIPIAALLGDQQSALFGQACFDRGESKNTYGTGCFMLMNIGQEIKHSQQGLLTTPAYQIGSDQPFYALEGSVAVAGALVQWLRDKLGIINSAPEINELAMQVEDCGDVYFVPAFSGLFAPHWRTDARGVITGLSAYAGKEHLARAVLESTAFQTVDLLHAMEKDSGVHVESLRVDGGMVKSQPLMQIQADLLNRRVITPVYGETTALGAAYGAGLAAGIWKDQAELRGQWQQGQSWEPQMTEELRAHKMEQWQKAIERSLGWV